MENGIAGLRIDFEEEEAWLINGGVKTQKSMHEYFLVGCFLTASVVHFPTMRNTIPNKWHPLGGVLILDLGERRFLFNFYHELDISRSHKWASWTFNNHLLVFHWLKDSENLMEVLLIYSYLWVQIHDLPLGMFSEEIAKQFEAFFGSFVEYDDKQISRGFKDFMRVRAIVDVRLPLKRRKKKVILTDKQFYARFQYEKLTLFYFLYGYLGHGDSFYLIWLTNEERNIELVLNLVTRAPGRKAITTLSIWLREDDGSGLYGKKSVG
ncbi:hypothetical protein J1N35_000329 [Gossypium stocksii]|uniref:DUF4283 domain-containing protein n=1 Tax=Gossypium stocksii TaxID=47602 RepID=A0A9D3WH99_9ROSI|nr:hypothetical protein J1N35_000329 [Gossypium stocksii]